MSSKNFGKPLTRDLIFTKTKSDNLQNIKNLNLWGNDLEDLSLIEKMPNLQVVSLSVNRISTLRDFSKCQKLQELYLRKNNIVDLNEIRYLFKLPQLKVLWLHDNPCAMQQKYREIVIKHLPNLVKLDNNPVTQQEKIQSQKVSFVINQQNDAYSPLQREYNPAQQKWQPRQPRQPLYEQKLTPSENLRMKKMNRAQQRAEQIKAFGKNRGSSARNSSSSEKGTQDISRNQNILMAVLSLLRELDQGSLQIVKRQTQSMLR